MKGYDIRFESDPSLDRVEVVIRAPELDEDVRALMDRLQDTRGPLGVFDGSGNLRTLTPDEIVSASTEGKLVHVVTTDGSWYTRRTLQSLESSLEGWRFVRISRYELVNLDKVQRYDFTIAGTLRLELVGGMETWASRRCIPDIRKRLLGRE